MKSQSYSILCSCIKNQGLYSLNQEKQTKLTKIKQNKMTKSIKLTKSNSNDNFIHIQSQTLQDKLTQVGSSNYIIEYTQQPNDPFKFNEQEQEQIDFFNVKWTINLNEFDVEGIIVFFNKDLKVTDNMDYESYNIELPDWRQHMQMHEMCGFDDVQDWMNQ